MQSVIVWALSLGLSLGVALRSFVALPWPFAVFVICLGVVALISAFAIHTRHKAYAAMACVLIACGFGVLRMDSATLTGDPILSQSIGEKVVLMGDVVDEPDIREKSIRLHMRAHAFGDGSTSSMGADVLVIAPRHSEVTYGDVIRAEGELQLPEAFDTTAGRTFNYPMFLAKDGILYTLAFAQVEVVGEFSKNPLKSGALWLKHVYLAGLEKTLPEPAAGLAGGITVGDKRSIGDELSGIFLKVSLIHIVVLSGFNMTVVINAAAHVLSFLPRAAKFGVSGVIVALFILMTGGAASAVRAGAMALLATYARLTGRTFIALRVLAIVSAVMILWNPYFLAFDPGFQLSILATLGLILYTPIISSRIQFLTEKFGIREIVASTISTQLMVLPLLLWQSGTLSLVSIPANLLALVVVPWAMLFSLVAAIAGIMLGHIGVFLALPALSLLSYIIKIAEFFGSLPLAAVTIPAFSAWLMCAAYIAIFYSYWWIQKKTAGDQPAVSRVD